MFKPPVEENVDVAVEKFATPWTERSEPGVDVPIPTRPPLLIRKNDDAEEPTASAGLEPRLDVSTENCASGEVVPTPMRPF